MELIKQKVSEYVEVCTVNEIREETMEVIVPDANPDFEAEISTAAYCFVSEKSLVSGKIRASGELKASVFYAAAGSERFYQIESASPFSQSFDFTNGAPDDRLVFDINVLGAQCEMINSRKLRVRIKTNVKASALRLQSADMTSNICGEQGEGICTLTKDYLQNACVEIADKHIAFTEEIRISDGALAAGDKILRTEAEWRADEVKVLQNKIMMRGRTEVTVYSISDALDVNKQSYSLPFSQVTDCRSTAEGDSAEITFQEAKISVQPVQKEDGGLFLVCEAGVTSTAWIYRQIPLKLLSDAYSTDYEMTTSPSDVSICGCMDSFRGETPVQARFDTPETPARVLDFGVSGYACTRGGKLFAEYTARLFYEAESGCARTLTASVEKEIEAPEGIMPRTLKAAAENIQLRTDQTGAEISFTGTVCGKRACSSKYTQVCDCKLDKAAKRCRRCKGNLVLRNITAGESVWSIAKQYGTTQNAIMSVNSFDDIEHPADGRLIMIPFVR